MPNTSPPAVRDAADVDPRVARSTRALGRALVELIQQRDFDAITVQHILDRAGVGRTTFYAHYRSKDDVLHASYERVFAAFEVMLERGVAGGGRLFPVAEFVAHVDASQGVVGALRAADRLDEAWESFAGHAARLIERRIERAADVAPGVPRRLVARMLAGALLEMLRWRQDYPAAATPAVMDTAFHELARGVLRSPRPARAAAAGGTAHGAAHAR